MAQRPRAKKTTNSLSKLSMELLDFYAQTDLQEQVCDGFCGTQKHILMTGYPGTGKTFLALANAFDLLEKYPDKYKRVVIVRSAVQTRDIGFLPGTLDEKALAYELPYMKIVSDLFGRGDAYGVLKKSDIIRFLLTSYVRGLTISDCILVIDEIQNFTANELSSVLTRTGKNTRVVMCGDLMQRDLTSNREKDVEKVLKILHEMNTVLEYQFSAEDIVRSGFVKDFIIKSFELYPDGL